MWLPCLLFLLFLHVGFIMHAAPHSSVIQAPATVTVKEGSALNMQCRFSGNNTKWAIMWYKVKGGKDVELHNSSLIHILTHQEDKLSNLSLESVDLEDSGTYLCKLVSSASEICSNGTQVTIVEITDFEVNQTSGPIREVEGANVTIECHFRTVRKSSSMYVSWDKDGLAVEQANKTGSYRITQNLRAGFASLTLTNATVSDSGFYRCNVGRASRNQSKSSGIASHVVITRANLSVIQSPAFIQGMEGQTLIINCSVAVAKNVQLLPYSVTWYKNGTDGHEEEVVGAGRTLSVTTGLASLILPNVQRNDSGTYRCAVGSNGRGNGTMVTISGANLSVIQSPAFIQGMEGQTLIINCSVAVAKNVQLLPYRVTWYKNGTDGHEEEVVGAGRTLSVTTGLATLVLPNVQRNNSGRYRCAVGSNGRGNGTMVTISERNKQLETDSGSPGAGAGIGAGAGAAAGILLLLLLFSALAWRYKKRAKESTKETEAASTKEAETHLPLTNQQKELTYASLRFSKKEVEPDAGVIYAEVRTKPKQRAGNSHI